MMMITIIRIEKMMMVKLKTSGSPKILDKTQFFGLHASRRFSELNQVESGKVALIVATCQPGWEEMENLRGNLRNFEKI